jgi:excisionase family DNA binding protein
MQSLPGQLSLFDVDAAGQPQSLSAEPAPPRDRVGVEEAVQVVGVTQAAGKTHEAEAAHLTPPPRAAMDRRGASSPESVTDRRRRRASPVSESLLSPDDVARRCGLSRKAVYRAVARGELRAARILSRLRIDPRDVEAWIRASVVDAKDPVPAPVPYRLSASTGLRRLLPDP